jgi:ketosteroid isomerase-like protein
VSEASGEVVRRLWELFQERRWDDAALRLADDFVADWPHTGERMRGRDNDIELNRNYPEPWSIEVRRVVASGDEAALEAAVSHPGGISHAAGFYTVRDGKIARATEYWVDARSQEPPAWRARWVETIE